MNKIKNFSVFKAKGDNVDPKTPTHMLSAKIGESYSKIGSVWTKENQYGKFLSCSLQDSWVDHSDSSKTRRAFCIVDEKELDALIKENKELKGEVDEPEIKEVADDSSEIPF